MFKCICRRVLHEKTYDVQNVGYRTEKHIIAKVKSSADSFYVHNLHIDFSSDYP